MTWLRSGGATTSRRHVFFNRDERKTRGPAIPPTVLPSGVIAPIDSDAGGTWLAVGPSGLVVALLNRWHEDPPPIAAPQSRGELPLMLAPCRSGAEAVAAVKALDLSCYRPFTLVLIDECDDARLDWDGSALVANAATQPITSSSYQFERVRAKRRQVFADLGSPTAESLRAFHNTPAQNDACTVRMNRSDAQTWSRSEIVIEGREVSFRYIDEPPDLVGESVEHNLSAHL